jgi:hypothetical protein
MSFRSGKSSLVGLILLALVLGGAVVGGALYQEQIMAFFTQQGWETGAAGQLVRTFAENAHTKGKGGAAGAALAPEVYKAVIKNGSLTSIEHGVSIGRRVDPVKHFVPTNVKDVKTELMARNGGSFRVLAQFENGKWGEFRVRRSDGQLKITQMPEGFTAEPPARMADDY